MLVNNGYTNIWEYKNVSNKFYLQHFWSVKYEST